MLAFENTLQFLIHQIVLTIICIIHKWDEL